VGAEDERVDVQLGGWGRRAACSSETGVGTQTLGSTGSNRFLTHRLLPRANVQRALAEGATKYSVGCSDPVTLRAKLGIKIESSQAHSVIS
jgi:hypothetical protein